MRDSANEPINVGIVGCGAVVQEFYSEIFRHLPNVRVKAVHDLNEANAKSIAAKMGAVSLPLPQLIQECGWIVITTPPEAHFEIAQQALASGRHVTVEKPFVTKVSDAVMLVQKAQAAGVGLYVAQFRRVFHPTQLSRQLISTGLIGRIHRLEMFEGGRFSWSTASGYVGRSKFGGVLFDTGSHVVDQALFAAGLDRGEVQVEIQSVRRDKPEPSHHIDAEFSLNGPSGKIAGRLAMSRASSLANLVRIYGTDGMLEFDLGYAGSVWLQRGGSRTTLAAQGQVGSYADAFLAEYREMFQQRQQSNFLAASTINQLRVLETIHQYVG